MIDVSSCENVWKNLNSKRYLDSNSSYDIPSGLKAWANILQSPDIDISSCFEYGTNVGRNLSLISSYINHPIVVGGFDIFDKAVDTAKLIHPVYSENFLTCSFSDFLCDFEPQVSSYDLVFSCSFLNCLPHSSAELALDSMFRISSKYILLIEYHSREPSSQDYRKFGKCIFKADYARILLNRHKSLEVVNYGFLWGHFFDLAGYDDLVFSLLRKV